MGRQSMSFGRNERGTSFSGRGGGGGKRCFPRLLSDAASFAAVAAALVAFSVALRCRRASCFMAWTLSRRVRGCSSSDMLDVGIVAVAWLGSGCVAGAVGDEKTTGIPFGAPLHIKHPTITPTSAQPLR